MTKTRDELLALLSRDSALVELQKLLKEELLPPTGDEVNIHIHTTYSGSPYPPTAAVYFARRAGLGVCGLMDDLSIAGAEEFLQAAAIAGMHATVGMACRVHMKGTPFAGRRLNSPHQEGVAWMSLHAVPHDRMHGLNDRFAPFREKRLVRMRQQTEAANALLLQHGLAIRFERDVLPLSNCTVGGSVTSQHIACAIARRLLEMVGSGEALAAFIREGLAMPLAGEEEQRLRGAGCMDALAGWVRGVFLPRIRVEATDELPNVREALGLCNEAGAIPAYAYVGGEAFEDGCLDALLPYLKGLGFRAVTCRPSRNSRAQLERLRALCGQCGLLLLSGEGVCQLGQPFLCEAQRDVAYRSLTDAAWALAAHEWRATADAQNGLFSTESVKKWPDLRERVRVFALQGRKL